MGNRLYFIFSLIIKTSIGSNSTYCKCNCEENIFCYEYCKESTAKSNMRSMNEQSFTYICRERYI